MKTLDLLNISTQVFMKVKIFIENEKYFLYEDYGYPLWKMLKYSTDWTLEHDSKINYIYNAEIKSINFGRNKLTIILKDLY